MTACISTTLKSRLGVYSTFGSIVFLCLYFCVQDSVCSCTQFLLFFHSPFLIPSRRSGPLLASKSSAKIVMRCYDSQPPPEGGGGCLSGSAISFQYTFRIQITSSELWPKANIQVNFSTPDLSTCFIPFQLGSVLFCPLARRGLKHERNHGEVRVREEERGYIWSPLTFLGGGVC